MIEHRSRESNQSKTMCEGRMGASPSKRVHQTLLNSPDFTATCATTYAAATADSDGILPYQLYPTSLRLHHSLLSTCPLIRNWSPLPPSRLHVDSAFRSLRRPEDNPLRSPDFTHFAAVLFTNAVLEGAGKALLTRVPIGVFGIAGVAVAGKVNNGWAAAAVGGYALGVATSIYISLG